MSHHHFRLRRPSRYARILALQCVVFFLAGMTLALFHPHNRVTAAQFVIVLLALMIAQTALLALAHDADQPTHADLLTAIREQGIERPDVPQTEETIAAEIEAGLIK